MNLDIEEEKIELSLWLDRLPYPVYVYPHVYKTLLERYGAAWMDQQSKIVVMKPIPRTL